MKKRCLPVLILLGLLPLPALGKGVKLVRYPHYHQGQVAWSYLGDVWTAAEDGSSVRRLTVHVGADLYPRFSPDGRWIAFSSARHGNLDVFVMPVGGGTARRLTFHSATDSVLGWTPDSKSILFSSQRREDFSGKLYTVAVSGGMPRDAGPDMGVYASYSPNGKKMAINRISQRYWRKHYRGSSQSDVTVMNLEARTFARLTEFPGMDRWPMWSRDRHIYFVSDRQDGGASNLWRVPEDGGQAEVVTRFETGEVSWPAMSADGRVIVFEHEHEIWKLDLESGREHRIELTIAAETQANRSEVKDFRSQLDEFDLKPSGKRIVFSVHGEIFTAPVKEGDLRQITSSAARDRDPHYSPNGKWIALRSDRSGREEIYVAPARGGEARRITDREGLKAGLAWSPDSAALAFTASDSRLYRHDLETSETVELASSDYGPLSSTVFSPDGLWVAYTKPDHSRRSKIYLVPSQGGEERAVTLESYSERSPAFTSDSRKLYFVRSEGIGGLGRPLESQIWSVTLEREERDPFEPQDDEAEDEPTEDDGEEGEGERARRQRRGGDGGDEDAPGGVPGDRSDPEEVEEIDIDWPGLKRRSRQLTRMPYGVSQFALAPDGKTILFVTREPAGDGSRTVATIYAIKHDGEALTRVSAGSPAREGDGPPGLFGGGGLRGLRLTSDGRTLYFQDGRSVYSLRVPNLAARRDAAPSGSRGGASPSSGGRGSQRQRIAFTAKVRIDYPREWTQMFDEAWRIMKHRFYDPDMHGQDWDALYERYRPLVDFVGDRGELMNVVNEMIGELNASHSGARGAFERPQEAVSTVHLGLDLEPDEKAGRYRVTHVYERGPSDHDWVQVEPGQYLIAIEGQEVRSGDNYWRFLNHRLNDKVAVTFNQRPELEGAWETRIEPASMGEFARLRYERWVRERRLEVEERSGGRIGYLHIRSMNQPSLRQFQRELQEYGDRQALVIDQRWNGGGNIEQELLGILVQRPYQILQPRGSKPTLRPAAGYFGPKVVLQNHRSGSNAEMFPAGFKALGLGKVIGTPTAGAVIGTGGYRLIDGSTVRTPASGVYLLDGQRTNMENFGVPPDILVENTPQDNLAGRDRQLEVAVEVLLQELGSSAPTADRK